MAPTPVKRHVRKAASAPHLKGHQLEPAQEASPSHVDHQPSVEIERCCSQCLRWSLTSAGDSRISFKPVSRLKRTKVVDGWGFPVQMAETTCPLCKLFALHAYDYAPQNFRADGMRGREYSLWKLRGRITQVLMQDNHPITSKVNFWFLDPSSHIRSNFPPLAGAGACIGKAAPDTPSPAHYLTARQVHPSRIDYAVLRAWLDTCRSSPAHRTCQDSVPGKILQNLVLIDCLAMPLKLVQSQKHHRYAALSYVWGRAGVDAHAAGDRLEATSLPLTVQDAITVTRRIGLRYLWVDRYCIPQDESVMQDQISNMDIVYGGSAITIVAAAGTDIEYGLPGVQSRPRKPQPCARVGADLYLSLLADPATTMQQTSWWDRAWCFQEAVLSPKRLIFTDDQVYFQCRNMLCVETLSLPFNHPGDLPSASLTGWSTGFYEFLRDARNTSGSDIIYDIIEVYSKKNMTYETDALRAIAGILRNFSRNSAVQGENLSYAGLPLRGVPSVSNFVRMLLWESHFPDRRRDGGFPSWSWTGFLGGFRFTNREGRVDEDIELRVVESNDCNSKGTEWDAFVQSGRLQDAIFPPSQYIHVHACTASVKVVHLATSRYQYGGAYAVQLQRMGSNTVRYAKVAMNYSTSSSGMVDDPGLHEEITGRRLKCMMLLSPNTEKKEFGIAILLRLLPPVEEEEKKRENVHERLGTFNIDFIGDCFDSDGNFTAFHHESEKGDLDLLEDMKCEWICLG